MASIMQEVFGDSLTRGIPKEQDDKSDNKIEVTMKDKCAVDFKLFCEYYLAENFPSPWSEKFHYWLIDKLSDITLNHAEEETRTVVAAPRGHAKSTLTTFAYVLWLTVYNRKKFIVIISATSSVAKQFLLNIRSELEFNEKIRKDFGDLTGRDIWNSNDLYTHNRVFITSKSAGTQLRGLNFNGTRPDTVILDDLETAEEVASPTMSQQLETWFQSDVLPMGCTTADFFYIGTVLSYESLLYHMLTKGEYSSWTRKRFQAVISFSTSSLWLDWEDIMVDLERGDHAYADAVEFYKEHKEEMLNGTEVLWESQRPDMYKHLMERRIASEEGFASEYMNDPQTEKTRVFKTEWLENNFYVDAPQIKEVAIAIDPAISSKRHADYSCIMIVGRGEDNYFYVLEADLAKRSPDKIIEDAKAYIADYYKYNPKIICETNQMQMFFSSTLQRDLVQSGIYLEWLDVFHQPGDSKQRRIESLVPHVKQGHIKFKASQRLLLGQMKNYPKAHDDGVDALEMALAPLFKESIANFSFGGVEMNKAQLSRYKSPKDSEAVKNIRKNFGMEGGSRWT